MNNDNDLRHEFESDPVVQAVVDRVLSWQAGAPVDTVLEELRAGLRRAGADMPEDWIERTAVRISHADPAQSGND